MLLLILSLMTVVGAFLVNSVMAFYLDDFYTRMQSVFEQEALVSDLRTPNEGEEDGGERADERPVTPTSGQLGLSTAAAASCISWTAPASVLRAAMAVTAKRRTTPPT